MKYFWNGNRAQASLEYMAMVGILLVVISVSVGTAFFIYNGGVANSTMINSMRDLRQAVNYVNALGNGSSIVVEIQLPNDVTGGTAKNKSIDYNAIVSGGISYYNEQVDANIFPVALPTTAGGHRLNITMVNNNIVIREV